MQGLLLSFGNFNARLHRHWQGIHRFVILHGNLRFPRPGLFLGNGGLTNRVGIVGAGELLSVDGVPVVVGARVLAEAGLPCSPMISVFDPTGFN